MNHDDRGRQPMRKKEWLLLLVLCILYVITTLALFSRFPRLGDGKLALSFGTMGFSLFVFQWITLSAWWNRSYDHCTGESLDRDRPGEHSARDDERLSE